MPFEKREAGPEQELGNRNELRNQLTLHGLECEAYVCLHTREFMNLEVLEWADVGC